MELTVLARDPNCTDTNTCPAFIAAPDDTDDVIVQGYVITDLALLAALGLPPGETAVRIPRSVLAQLVAQLGAILREGATIR